MVRYHVPCHVISLGIRDLASRPTGQKNTPSRTAIGAKPVPPRPPQPPRRGLHHSNLLRGPLIAGIADPSRALQEYHLQTILNDAGTSNDQEIPVPPPQESDISYDGLYPSHFHQPTSYLRFSQTVEECISCQYDMTEEDVDFLRQYNGKPPPGGPLSDDDFEFIMEVFEETAAEQTPFASVDNTVAPYDAMVPGLGHIGSPSVMQHAKSIYEYWKTKRKEAGNKPIHPMLKFETHQDSDDTDPYVCFRRREARQTRKTRARDNKIADTLKRLRRELEEGRQLVLLSSEREMMKRELLYADRAVFEERARLKQMKVRLGVKEGDEDLINQKVCGERMTPRAPLPMLTCLHSHRNVRRRRCLLPRGLMDSMSVYPYGPTAELLSRTWSCSRTSGPRGKRNSVPT